jgi:hypothetical protein
MGYLLCTCAMRVCAICACVHCTHARVCTLLNTLSPTLVETFIASQTREQHNLLLRARLRLHAMRVGTRTCTYVRSHILGRICSNIGENIPLRGLHAFYVCTCVCTLYAHYTRELHACARSHILVRILSNILRITDSYMVYLIFTCARACAHHACMCAFTYFGTDSLQT